MTLATPWPERRVRESVRALTGRDLPDDLEVVSLGPGPDLPVLARRWPTPVFGGIRARLERFLRARPGAILYTRARRAVAEVAADAAPTVVYECHELHGTRAEEERRAVARAAAVVAVTAGLAEDLRRERGCRAPIEVLPNAADPAIFAIPEGERRVEAGRFVYMGSLHAWKGVALALEALARVPGATLDVCGGDLGGREAAALAAQARRLGIEARVRLHGALAQPALRPVLARAAAALLPLDAAHPIAARHTSPLKLFESLVAGVPVVATDLPAIREHVRPGENGVVFAPGDAASLAAVLGAIASDPALRDRLARGARASGAAHTWRRRGERVIELCRAARARSS